MLSLHALPYPALRLQKRIPLPRDLGLRVSYECPLDALSTFFRPPARLMLSLDTIPEHGLRLTSAGVEVNQALELWGGGRRCGGQGWSTSPGSCPWWRGSPGWGLRSTARDSNPPGDGGWQRACWQRACWTAGWLAGWRWPWGG